MYRVALINMPFAAAESPSIALTQLKAVLERDLGDRVSCDIHYLNLEFVSYLGLPLFQAISNTVEANTSGLGDWFFSPAAFPEMRDEPELYLSRHFAGQRTQLDQVKHHLLSRRRTAGEMLVQLIEKLGLIRYSLIGFTSMFSQNVASFAMAKALKRQRPELVTAMGGANCESPMGEVIARQVGEIDFVFSGPALLSFPRLVRHLLCGEEVECHRIKGVLSRRKLQVAATAQPQTAAGEIGDELDIDEEVPLDYDDFFAAFDRKLRGTGLAPVVPFETSRGCWWGERSHCTFCGLNGMTMSYRAMAPKKAIDLLHGLFARYGGRTAEFQSVDNILPRRYLTDVLPLLSPPEHAQLFYEIKADLKEHELAVLKRAHVTKIQPGIEALSTQTLKLMRKGTTAFQNLKFLMHCLAHGIQPLWNLLVGFPREPEAVYRKYHDDIPLLLHLPPPAGAFPVRFDRFSPYHKQAAEYGLELRACDFYGMVYPFPAAELDSLAYFFRDGSFSAAYQVATARWLGKLQRRVADWQSRWQGSGGAGRPELAARQSADGSWSIHDSRGASLRQHRLDAQGWRLLSLLGEQRKLASLAERCSEMEPTEIEQRLAQLRERGLLFEEDGVYLSLVSPARPAAQMNSSRVCNASKELATT